MLCTVPASNEWVCISQRGCTMIAIASGLVGYLCSALPTLVLVLKVTGIVLECTVVNRKTMIYRESTCYETHEIC